MIFYALLLGVIGIVAAIVRPTSSKKQAKTFSIVAFGILCLVSSFRSINVGVDTLQYCNNYQVIALMDWSDYGLLRYEPGFFFLCKALSCISTDYRLLIFATSLIIFFGVCFFYYKLSENHFVTVFLFVTLLIDAFLMSGMRQALAMSIALVGLYQLLNGRRALFCILVLFASQFHSSAIVCFIYWPLLNSKFSTKTFVALVVGSVIAFVFASQLYGLASGIIGKYDGYDAGHEHGGSNYFGALIRAAFYLLMAFISHYCLKDKYGTDSENVMTTVGSASISGSFMMYAAMLAFMFNVLGMQIEIFARMNNYFNVFLPLLLPCGFNRLSTPQEKTLLTFVTLSICFAYFAAILLLRPEWNGIVPYTTFF